MQLKENVNVAFDGLLFHKFRSFLTMLGIIFGVAAVIAMLSIGEGAKQEAVKKYENMGINNIILRDKELSEEELDETRAKFSQGLSREDAKAIEKIVPNVKNTICQSEQKAEVYYKDRSLQSTIIGVNPKFHEILNYRLSAGNFIDQKAETEALKTCVIGFAVADELFRGEAAIGKKIKAGDQWFEVIGILENKSLFTETAGEMAARDLNFDIYIPLKTFLQRIPRENILESELKQITIQIEDVKYLLPASEIIKSLMDRRHYNNDDYTMVIPYELLKQEEKERRIYNILLGSIAAISLLVGGIGIMNIMLATVMERTREIGIRMAVGATENDILSQFITEAVVISITGGVIGVVFGITMSLSIQYITNVTTSITFFSIILSFFVSVAVGIIFGFLPAKKAAALNPIESLRYE